MSEPTEPHEVWLIAEISRRELAKPTCEQFVVRAHGWRGMRTVFGHCEKVPLSDRPDMSVWRSGATAPFNTLPANATLEEAGLTDAPFDWDAVNPRDHLPRHSRLPRLYHHDPHKLLGALAWMLWGTHMKFLTEEIGWSPHLQVGYGWGYEEPDDYPH